MPKAVIFDWDNTLVDTWPYIHKIYNYTLKQMGHEEWTLEETKARVHRTLREFFPGIFGDRWKEAIQIYIEQSDQTHLDHLKPLPGAEITLKWLKQKQVPTFIVSNKRSVKLRKEIAHLGWEKYFDLYLGDGDSTNDKPHKEPVERVLKSKNLNTSKDIWFIGDTVVDLECAHNSGLHPVLFGDIDHTHPRFTPYKPFIHTPSHEHLLNQLELIIKR